MRPYDAVCSNFFVPTGLPAVSVVSSLTLFVGLPPSGPGWWSYIGDSFKPQISQHSSYTVHSLRWYDQVFPLNLDGWFIARLQVTCLWRLDGEAVGKSPFRCRFKGMYRRCHHQYVDITWYDNHQRLLRPGRGMPPTKRAQLDKLNWIQVGQL